MKLILGSQSPRRRELLKGLDIPFEATTIDCDEHYPADLTRGDIPLYIAKQKAAAYFRSHPDTTDDTVLLTADTIVWLDEQMLGKPKDIDDAKRMLHLLSNRTHQVYTAVCLTTANHFKQSQTTSNHFKQSQTNSNNLKPFQTSFVDCTDVTFMPLTDEQIDYYVEHYRPLDKAGAYGVQEYIGYVAVSHLNGSFYNVMGLPVHRILPALQTFM